MALCALLLLCASGVARADLWYEHYDRGKRAIENQEWDRAIEELEEALRLKNEPSDRARTYGMNFTEYYPFYYMGIAFQESGNSLGALDAYAASERMGAVAKDATAWQDLQDRRQRITDALDAEAEAERRLDRLYSDALSRATNLERAGRLSDALAAVEEAVSIRSTDEAEALRDDLVRRLAEQRARADLADRISDLVDRGRQALDGGSLEQASSLAKQALALGPSVEAEALRNDAEAALRARVASRVAEEQRQEEIASSLEQAEALGREERFIEAIDLLQRALALDPGNAEASKLQADFLTRQRSLQDDERRKAQLAGFESDAERYEDDGELPLAISLYRQALDMFTSPTFSAPPDPGAETRITLKLLRAQRKQSARSRDAFPMPPEPLLTDDRRDWIVDAHGLRLRSSAETSATLPRGVERHASPAFRRVFEFQDHTYPEAVVCSAAFSERMTDTVPGPESFSTIPCAPRTREACGMVFTSIPVVSQLTPGQTFFRITSQDWTGKSGIIEYAVVYLLPWYRQTWFYALLIGSALAFLSGSLVHREKRRRELRKRHYNPFIAGAPVLDEDKFFGRERLLKRILQSVHHNSILLYGERRIGKTSLQHRLKNRLAEIDDREFDFYPVYIDLQGVPEERFFATLGDEIFTELGRLLDGVEPNALLHEGTQYQYREFVRDLRAVLKKLDERSPKQVKLVLLMDEVDALNEYDPRTNQRLRSLFMRNFADKLVTVCSGVAIKKHWESEGSPWYNFFEEIPVEAFQREDAEQLILKPLRGMFKVDDGVVDRIIELSDCKPFLIQKLCISLVQRLHHENRRRITVQDVDTLGGTMEA